MVLEDMFDSSNRVFSFFLRQFNRFKTALQQCSKSLEFRNFTDCLCIFLRSRFNRCRWFNTSFRFLSCNCRSRCHFSQGTKSLGIGFFFRNDRNSREIEWLCKFLRRNVQHKLMFQGW